MRQIPNCHSPKVSVLMPCYNASRWLHDAIDSVLEQTFQDYEFILVDDGSTDDTQVIIEKYAEKDKRIKIISKSNSGIADSLNIALSASKGEWIARLDADDVAMPNRLQKQMEYIERRSEIVLLGSGCIVIDRYGNEIKNYKYPGSHHEIVHRIEKMGSPFPHSSTFFSRKLAQKTGGYHNRLNGAEDIDLWLRISNLGLISCLPEPLIKLRKHSDSITAKNSKLVVVSIAAIICNLRRKEGLSDPSRMEENRWKEFLDWLGKRMEEESIFQERRSWQTMRDAYYNHNGKTFEGIKAVVTYLIKNPKGLKAIWRRFFKTNVALKLAEESKLLF